MERLKVLNLQSSEEKDGIQADLYKVTEELINQTNINLEQTKNINQLGMEIERLRNDLDIAIKYIPSVSDPERPFSKTFIEEEDELDQRLNDYLASSHLPVAFSKIAIGEYKFGSKVINLKILNGKLVVRVGGGYMIIQDFLRLFTIEEIKKLKEKQAEEKARKELVDMGRKEEKRAYANALAAVGKKSNQMSSENRNSNLRESNASKSPATGKYSRKESFGGGASARPPTMRK
jgi:hypothetical protein